jgi:hypothetical protein
LSCSSRVLACACFDPFCPGLLVARSLPDGLRVGRRVSAIRGVVLEVRVAFSDGPPYACVRSARSPCTVHPLHTDGPPEVVQIA